VKLGNLKWDPKWVSHLGCVKGCLDYLGIEVSDAWLFGATGHAFVINIHQDVCPSGPTAWKTEMLFHLGRNVGYDIEGVFSHKSAKDFAEKQNLAFEKVKNAINRGLPCYGWELDIPEFYVVHGYDEEGYYYRGFDNSEEGPKPWKELGDTGIGALEMCVFKKGNPVDDTLTIKEALAFVLEHSKNPKKWIFPKYKSGIEGYDTWISALETNTADGFGNAYNIAVWNECRQNALNFLIEAKKRLNEDLTPLLDNSISHYEKVAENFESLMKIFPFSGPSTKGDEIKEPELVAKGLEHLKAARNAEKKGLHALNMILKKLES
jgi:hypothetical protein